MEQSLSTFGVVPTRLFLKNVMPPLKGSLSLNILAYRLYRLHVFGDFIGRPIYVQDES